MAVPLAVSGGVQGWALLSVMGVCASIVDLSPFSTTGALIVEACRPRRRRDRHRLSCATAGNDTSRVGADGLRGSPWRRPGGAWEYVRLYGQERFKGDAQMTDYVAQVRNSLFKTPEERMGGTWVSGGDHLRWTGDVTMHVDSALNLTFRVGASGTPAPSCSS